LNIKERFSYLSVGLGFFAALPVRKLFFASESIGHVSKFLTAKLTLMDHMGRILYDLPVCFSHGSHGSVLQVIKSRAQQG